MAVGNVAYIESCYDVHFLRLTQGYTFFFKEGLCWSDINTTFLKCRMKQKSINDVKSMSLYGLSSAVPEYYIICLINSSLISYYVDNFVNNTQTFQINDARQLPIIIPDIEQIKYLEQLFQAAIKIKKSSELSEFDKDKNLENLQDKLDDSIKRIYGLIY